MYGYGIINWITIILLVLHSTENSLPPTACIKLSDWNKRFHEPCSHPCWDSIWLDLQLLLIQSCSWELMWTAFCCVYGTLLVKYLLFLDFTLFPSPHQWIFLNIHGEIWYKMSTSGWTLQSLLFCECWMVVDFFFLLFTNSFYHRHQQYTH